MSEKIPDTLTLFELFDFFDVIEVPIIQRDYAQGRQDDHAKMVRGTLLKDIESAISGKTDPLDLNFVYGKREGKKFIPIDGQQRLTTLFLLYLYAFRDDESKTGLFNKFTYETRSSSRKFFKKLIEKRSSVFKSDLPPSEEIEDSEWFVFGWKYDPTIQSVFTMLDDIKEVFKNKENLTQCLSDNEKKRITFKFLESEELGMEDNLYIKLNARGKPLTPLENFKAQLIKRIQNLKLDFIREFEINFDVKWTKLFWLYYNESFDFTYLTFFWVLLMNKGVCSDDKNWSINFDYEKIDTEILRTIFLTLNFLADNPEREDIRLLVFNTLTEKPKYQDRILFHAVTVYLHLSKGIDTGSLKQWVRIIKNLALNTQIDNMDTYRRAINGINGLSDNWKNLLDYFAQNAKAPGFSPDQAEEEQKKAQIIKQNDNFAEIIYKAEEHPYFSGQIRSALYYAIDEKSDMEVFNKYWNKISALFDNTKPKHRHLLRQALLVFGDYTLTVSEYNTLCVDDPNESSSTPSMKKLFSGRSEIVKKLLDTLDLNNPIEEQLHIIINNSNVYKNDWRYCFIKFPILFSYMSDSHLRLRYTDDEIIIVRNKSSTGFNYGVFLTALHELLNQKGIRTTFRGDLGTWAYRYLTINQFNVRFKKGKFIITDTTNNSEFETKTDDPLTEASEYLQK